MSQFAGSGGGPITDGADVAIGTTTDAAWVSGAGTVVSILKKIASTGGSVAADTTASGVLGSLNATLQVAMAGLNSAAITLPAANNLVGTLLAESTADSGATWAATVIRSSASTGLWAGSVAVSSTNAAYNIQVPGGASHVRVRVNPYTSGTATASIRATTQIDSQPDPLVQGTQPAGSASQPNPLAVGGWDGAAVRTFKTDNTGIPQVAITGTVTLGNLPTQPFLNATDFNDVTASSPTRGDIITAQGASPKYARLGIGGANTLLHGGTEPSYSAVAQADVTGGYVTTDATAQSVTGVKTWTVNANLKTVNSGIHMADQEAGATGKLKIEAAMSAYGGYRFSLAPMEMDNSSLPAAATAPQNSYVLDMRAPSCFESASRTCMHYMWGGPNGGGVARPFFGFMADASNSFPFGRFFIYNELSTAGGAGGYPLGADLDILARGASDLHLVNDTTDSTQTATTSVTAGTAASVTVTSTANWPSPNVTLLGQTPNYGTLLVADSTGANLEFLGGVAGVCTTGLLTVNGQYCILDSTHVIIRTANNHTQPYVIAQQGRGFFDMGRVAINAKAFAADTQKRQFQFVDSSTNFNDVLALPSDTSGTWPLSGIMAGVAITGQTATGAHGNLLFRNNTSADSILTQNAAGTAIWTQVDGGTLTAGSTAILDLNAASGTTGLKIPVAAGAAPTANGNIAYDSTANKPSVGINGTNFKLPIIVASGTSAMTTAAIASGAAGTTVTTAATGTLTTDTIVFTRNAAATAANGGLLTLNAWVTAGNVNFNYVNPTAASNTPTAMTLNWQVHR